MRRNRTYHPYPHWWLFLNRRGHLKDQSTGHRPYADQPYARHSRMTYLRQSQLFRSRDRTCPREHSSATFPKYFGERRGIQLQRSPPNADRQPDAVIYLPLLRRRRRENVLHDSTSATRDEFYEFLLFRKCQ